MCLCPFVFQQQTDSDLLLSKDVFEGGHSHQLCKSASKNIFEGVTGKLVYCFIGHPLILRRVIKDNFVL